MNRMDRLFALVLQLQARGMARASDLARAVNVSQRTVYRDVQTLCYAGVPIASLPGQGYALPADYFLPPLLFTGLEAGALALGAEHVSRTLDAPFRSAAGSARAKLGNALTAEGRRDLRAVEDGFASGTPDPAPAHQSLHELREAIVERRALRIAYHAFGRARAEEREVEPYGLVHFGQAWQLLAFCRQRQAPHMFRLDRIDQVEMLDEQFVPGERTGRQDYAPSTAGRAEIVEVRVAGKALRSLLQNRPSGSVIKRSEGPFTVLSFDVTDPEHLLRWLLQWAGEVEVLAPPSLRRRVAAMGELITAAHSGNESTTNRNLLDIG